ncbi:MAG: hypothetical protein IJJ69_08580 [Oscillospiraceae bacterium]|nr:hypothetical protein [Oscillospiraceae bacterium]
MMSEENKYCSRCGKLISTPEGDYFSHIKILYCDECRKEVEREQTRQRVAELKKRKKQKDKFRDEELEQLRVLTEQLKEEVELLREGNQAMREENGLLRMQNQSLREENGLLKEKNRLLRIRMQQLTTEINTSGTITQIRRRVK